MVAYNKEKRPIVVTQAGAELHGTAPCLRLLGLSRYNSVKTWLTCEEPPPKWPLSTMNRHGTDAAFI
jgi:hypothetical protein